jgi:hypothetical protein
VVEHPAQAEPPALPIAVPTMPMAVPWAMKMAMMLRADAPMVLRMAMSRLFCITIRMSDEMMFSAPTMTMRATAIEIPIFSSHSAEKSDWFIDAQSRAS